ncbi:MAG: HD domain-containing protein [Blautia sp.]|nr:HD domain-containing protein [Blautia sp.]
MDQIRIDVPDNAGRIIDRLYDAGFEAYVVGGCVRDALMGRTAHDWDICTSADPQQVCRVFSDVPVIRTGIQHGTVTVLMEQTGYEVTTFRTDGDYSDGRHPDSVHFVTRLQEDLGRRDFTINAMAYNDKTGLVDLYGGAEDLRDRRIRCVGDPMARFSEDVLRIMRAVRFAAVLDFDIEETTGQAVHACIPSINKVSAERITTELRKMVCGVRFPALAAEFTDLFVEIIPEFAPCVGFDQRSIWHCYDVWEHILATLASCSPEADEITRLALLFHDIGKPYVVTETPDGHRHFRGHGKKGMELTDQILRRLKFDNRSREEICQLVLYHDDTRYITRKGLRRLLSKVGATQLQRLLLIHEADMRAQEPEMIQTQLEAFDDVKTMLRELLSSGEKLTLKALAIHGEDLKALGFCSGEGMGRTLTHLLDMVIDEDLPNEKEPLTAEALAFGRSQGLI